MRVLRQPTRFLVLWTAMSAVPTYLIVAGAMEPVDSRCREWCDLSARIAVVLVPIIILVWLGVLLLAVWLWNRR